MTCERDTESFSFVKNKELAVMTPMSRDGNFPLHLYELTIQYQKKLAHSDFVDELHSWGAIRL